MVTKTKTTSKKGKKFYITTAIDYVNAKPHIGHAYEKVLADALARWHRLIGEKVWFLTGTDENAQKNALVAREKGIEVAKFVKDNSDVFEELCKKLGLSNDDFIRTTETRHVKKVKEIFKEIYDKGDIYKGKYEGLYCTGCEAFVTEKDLVDGKCPEHNREPLKMSEDAYFFKLSKYQVQIQKLIRDGLIIPREKGNEILSRLEAEDLRDLCVSRTNLDWGIDSPIDKKFKIYVWIDALSNYVTALGNKEDDFWPADVHVIGKGINWFHTVIWPAILLSAGYKIPKNVLVHGYLNLGGQKMSKSLGNVIDPLELLKKYEVDSVRYSLLKCSVFEDSDYSEEILVNRNNNELADKLGNLVSRTSTLAEKYGVEKCDNKLLSKLKIKEIEEAMNNFEVEKALGLIFNFVDRVNEFVQEKKPWETHDKKVLYQAVDSIKAIAVLLSAFIPGTCEKIAQTLGFEIKYSNLDKNLVYKNLKKSEILFKKIETSETQQSSKKEVKEKLNKPKENKNIEGIATMTDLIKYDDFAKLDLRVGTIKKIEDVEGADKLLKLEVDTGKDKRTILAGIKKFYTKEELKGKQIIVICNLEPRKMRGFVSEGMLLAAVSEDESSVVLLSPEKKASNGWKVQ
ncbi:methionine--tRNA ligase [Candidatus Pacearchaeota archaeon]|nr:methionine--tRNA ligase [Candidatus Pacearchaeota archaeon]